MKEEIFPHKPYPTLDQNGSKTIPFGAAHTYIAYIAYIREFPPQGAKNALQIMSLAAYASESNMSFRCTLHKIVCGEKNGVKTLKLEAVQL